MTSLSAESDEALAKRAAAGDERAFAGLVRRHQEPLYRLLRRYTGNADQAYEATHETFIAAWRFLGRYDSERSFVAWLRTIAFNKARDRGRRLMVQRFLLGSDDLDGDQAANRPDPGATADEAVIEGQTMAALDHAISRLPAKLKEPLLLTAFEGLSQKDAGDILGVSEKAVETRVYRARKILAEALDPDMRPKA